MRNIALMAAGCVLAMGASFAALGDGPARQDSAYDASSPAALYEHEYPEYVERQVDGDTWSRATTVRDRNAGYESGVPFTTAQNDAIDDPDHRMIPIAEESIAVQAHRLPSGAPVAVHGMVQKISGSSLVIERGGTRVHARLPGMLNADDIARGDDVTVYGRLVTHGTDIAVRAEAVLLRTSLSEGHLFMAPSRLESVNKTNHAPTRAAARNALDHYRFNFTPL